MSPCSLLVAAEGSQRGHERLSCALWMDCVYRERETERERERERERVV